MKTSLDVNPEVWKRVRVLAAAQDISLGAAVDGALREWVAQRQAELDGMGGWIRSEIRQENEPEVAGRVREAQAQGYRRAHAEIPKRRAKKRPTKQSKKGGDRR
jgi:predicted transcriptional regulator